MLYCVVSYGFTSNSDWELSGAYRPPVAEGPPHTGLQVAGLRIGGRPLPHRGAVLALQLQGPPVRAPHAGHPPALGAPSTADGAGGPNIHPPSAPPPPTKKGKVS